MIIDDEKHTADSIQLTVRFRSTVYCLLSTVSLTHVGSF